MLRKVRLSFVCCCITSVGAHHVVVVLRVKLWCSRWAIWLNRVILSSTGFLWDGWGGRGADMAHAELDITTITNSQSTTSLLLSSYSPPPSSAILKKSSPTQQQSAGSARNCGTNVAIALNFNRQQQQQQQRRKTVYFTVGQRQEVAIFEDYTPSEDIKSKRVTSCPMYVCIRPSVT